MSAEAQTMEPPSKKPKLDDQPTEPDPHMNPADDFSKDDTMDGEDQGFSVSNDKYSNFVTPAELERLREFQVLDEVKSNDEDSNEDDSDSSDGKSEGLPEEEIEKMLEEDLPDDFKGAPKPKEKSYITRQKTVLEEKGVNHFEVLPLDWMMARHYSGMPVYMHRATRVCTLSKPYFLGKGNARRHDIPISAIPCLAYRKALEEERKQTEIDKQITEQIKSGAWKQNLSKDKEDDNKNCDDNVNCDLGYNVKSLEETSVKSKSDDSVFKCPFSGNTSNEKIAEESIDVNSKCPFKQGSIINDGEFHKNCEENNEDAIKSYPNDDSLITSEDIPKIEAKTNSYEGFGKEQEITSPHNVIGNDEVTTDKLDVELDNKDLDTTKKINSKIFKIDINTLTKTITEATSNNEVNTAANDTAGNNEPTNDDNDKAGNTEPTNDDKDNTGNIEPTNDDKGESGNTGTTNANKDKAGNTESNNEVPLNRQPVVLPGGIVMPPPRVETVSSSWKTQHLTPEEVNEYCKSLFKFKTVNIMHFKRWADRRKYTKARKTLQYPTLPEGTKLITIPAQPSNGQENGGKAAKRDWVMNMNGRSYLSVFHEYVRRALHKQPIYEFKQLENASTPYQATVYIGGMQYGVGRGSSKRAAKSAAARASIHILIPEMRHELDDRPPGEADGQAEPDFSFFDYVGIEDPRIAEFCAAACEPAPHAVLRTCLLRNFGAGDRHVRTEMKKLEYQKIELTMKVGKHSATVVCKNKKTAKQRASQAILQALHPHVRSWGSLLRLYGSRSVKSCKERKLEEQQITLLQDAAKHNEPNYAVLEKLRNEMRKLRDRDEAVVPIGTLLLRDDLPTHSGSNLNNVDL